MHESDVSKKSVLDGAGQRPVEADSGWVSFLRMYSVLAEKSNPEGEISGLGSVATRLVAISNPYTGARGLAASPVATQRLLEAAQEDICGRSGMGDRTESEGYWTSCTCFNVWGVNAEITVASYVGGAFCRHLRGVPPCERLFGEADADGGVCGQIDEGHEGRPEAERGPSDPHDERVPGGIDCKTGTSGDEHRRALENCAGDTGRSKDISLLDWLKECVRKDEGVR